MGCEAPAASWRVQRAAVLCNSGPCPWWETAVTFPMLDQLHAVGFSIFDPAGLVKKDSRMGWSCPHYCLGISVMSTAPHHGCLFLLCPRESMFVAYRWFLSVLPVLGAIRWAITFSPPLSPGSIAPFLSSMACLFYTAKQMSGCLKRMCSACVMAAPAHTCFGNTPGWARLWCELHRQHLSKRKSFQIWKKN